MSDQDVRYAIKRDNGLWLKAGGKLEWIGDWSRRACFFDRRAAVEAQEDAGVACRIVRITRITRRVKEKRDDHARIVECPGCYREIEVPR